MKPAGKELEFGPFRYDPGQHVLFREGEIVPLPPKAVDTLHALLDRRGRVVDKDELMKLVWPDTTVEEVGLARNISLLRKALGDAGESYIETIPKRGYRFVAQLSEMAPARRPRRWPWVAAPSALLALAGWIYLQFYAPSAYLPHEGEGYASLAAIPFECLPASPECTAFSQGFNEVLVAELSKLDGVHVISPSTVRRYQRVGIAPNLMARMLWVAVTLEGVVQEAEGRRRITARLADVHSGKLIWADTLDGPSAQQAGIVAAAVGARLRPSR